MKIQIYSDELSKPLNQVAKALPKKSVVPILSNILFRADDEGLHLVASDSTTTIKSFVPVSEFELISTGSITLPGKKILEIVEKINGELIIEVRGDEVTISCGKSRFVITGMNAEEYPVFPETKGDTVTIDGTVLKNMIRKTIYATSDNEATMILTGIHFNLSHHEMTLTATDRHRMARIKVAIESEIEHALVISNESLAEFMKILPEKKDVELSFQGDRFVAKSDQFTFMTRILEGNYPDVEKAVPTSFKGETTVKTSDLIEIVDRIMIVASEEKKTNKIKISVSDDITIVANTQNYAGVESIDYAEKEGDDFSLGMNAKYLLDALKAIDDEFIKLNYSGDVSPFIITADSANWLHMVLPFRIMKEE